VGKPDGERSLAKSKREMVVYNIKMEHVAKIRAGWT